jgi:hypothetical protein
MAFDPKAFLGDSAPASQGFDPAAFLGLKPAAPSGFVSSGGAGPGSIDPDEAQPDLNVSTLQGLRAHTTTTPEQRARKLDADASVSHTDDPGVQAIVGGVVGAGAGELAAPLLSRAIPAAPRIAQTIKGAVEGAAASKAQGGDATSGAILGAIPGAASGLSEAGVRRLARAGTAAEERGVVRAADKIEERTFKRTKANIHTDPVMDLLREEPEVRKATGNDAKLTGALDTVREKAGTELDEIYRDSSAARNGLSKEVPQLQARAEQARAAADELRAKAPTSPSLFEAARQIDAPQPETRSLFDLARDVDAPKTGPVARAAGRSEFAEKEAARAAEANAADAAATDAERQAAQAEKALKDRRARIESMSAVPVDHSVPLANMDAKIAELRTSKLPSSQKTAVALQGLRDDLETTLGDTSTSPKQLRAIQSDYQKTAYGKAMPGDTAATINIAANQEASKAVGDAVFQHVTGMSYADAQAAAAVDPGGVAARLLKANDKISAANKIEAGIRDRQTRVQPRHGFIGRALDFAHDLKHHGITGTAVSHGLANATSVLGAVDRGIAAGGRVAARTNLPPLSTATNPGAVAGATQLLRLRQDAPAQPSLNLQAAKALMAIKQAAQAGPVPKELVQQAIDQGVPQEIAYNTAGLRP